MGLIAIRRVVFITIGTHDNENCRSFARAERTRDVSVRVKTRGDISSRKSAIRRFRGERGKRIKRPFAGRSSGFNRAPRGRAKRREKLAAISPVSSLVKKAKTMISLQNREKDAVS